MARRRLDLDEHEESMREMYDAGLTGSEIVEQLKEQGVIVSVRTVYYRVQNYKRELKEQRENQQFAKAIVDEMNNHPDFDVTDAITHTLQTQILEYVRDLKESGVGLEFKDASQLIHAVESLKRSKVDVAREKFLQDQGAKKALGMVREAVFGLLQERHPDLFHQLLVIIDSIDIDAALPAQQKRIAR